MKTNTIMILSLLMATNLLAAASNDFKEKVKEYDNLFQQIGEKRVGISNSKIDKIKNPFVMTYKKTTALDGNVTIVQKVKYILNATLNNKAKINGAWYKKNSKIGDFKLIKVSSKSVIIKNEHSKKELFIRKSNVDKIKFSSK